MVSCHNWGAVPPNLPLSDCQISETNGIVGSRDYAHLHTQSVINNHRSLILAYDGANHMLLGKRGGTHTNRSKGRVKRLCCLVTVQFVCAGGV